MALEWDPDDVEALDARIEAQGRVVFAGALRMQAMGLRTQADLATSMARTLDAQADAVEDGREPLPQRPMRLEVVPDAPEPEEASRAERWRLQRINSSRLGNAGVFLPLDDELFTPDMEEFLGLFDDRLRLDAFFVGAVNDAAAQSMPASRRTAQWVQQRVYERREAAKGGDDGGE